MMTLAALENKLSEYKKIFSLYDVAITEHERQIDKAVRGKLTFTQIENKVLMGLLKGDLTKLHTDKEQVGKDIVELEEQIKSAKEKPSPEASVAEKDQDQAPTGSEFAVNLENERLQGGDDPSQEDQNKDTSDPFIGGNTTKDSDSYFNPVEDFGTNDIETPDLLTNHQILDSLQAIEESEDNREESEDNTEGFQPLFPSD